MLFGLPPIHADYTDYTARAAIVEGYNTNVYQSIDADGVGHRHASLFTGIEGMVQAHITGRDPDRHDFRFGGRAQHYMAKDQQDDGSIFASWSSQFATSNRTRLIFGSSGTITSLNSSHISDGTLYLVDPTVLRRTYWLTTTDASVAHDLSPSWTVFQRLGFVTSGTLESAPLTAGSTAIPAPAGIDYMQFESETTAAKVFTPRTTGDVRWLVRDTYSAFRLDLANPANRLGAANFLSGTATAAVTYTFTPRLVNRIGAGASIASAPPLDHDQHLVISPTFVDQLNYSRETWYTTITAQYAYGTLNPRLGTGPGVTAGAVIVGIPYPVGHWRNLGVLGAGSASYATISTGVGPSATLNSYGASAQLRYATSTWLGITAGYTAHYSSLTGSSALAQATLPLTRHVFFVGLSGYWSTDPSVPPLATFQPPVAP